MEIKKKKYPNEEIQSKKQTLEILDQSVSKLTEEFILLLKTFFDFNYEDEDIKKKVGIQYALKCDENNLINSIEIILESVKENGKAVNTIFSGIKKVIETDDDIKLQIDKIRSLAELSKTTDEKTKNILNNFSIEVKTFSLNKDNNESKNTILEEDEVDKFGEPTKKIKKI